MKKALTIIALALAVALVVGTGAGVEPPRAVEAQGPDEPFVDLRVSFESVVSFNNWNPMLTVTNLGNVPAFDVRVDTSESRVWTLAADEYAQLHADFLPLWVVPVGWYDRETGVWTIPRLDAGDSVSVIYYYSGRDPGIRDLRTQHNGAELVLHQVAEVAHSAPPESPLRKQNGRDEIWSHVSSVIGATWHRGPIKMDAGIWGVVDNILPEPGDVIKFTLTRTFAKDDTNIRGSGDHPLDQRVTIQLTDGLEYVSHSIIKEPDSEYTPSTGVWSFPGVDAYGDGLLELNVRLKSDAVPEGQCITAELSAITPERYLAFYTAGPKEMVPQLWGGNLQRDNRVEICFEDTETATLAHGDQHINLFVLVDCIGKNRSPCGNEDSLKVVSVPGEGSHDYRITQPGNVTVHVPDPSGRNTSSVPGSDALVWSTGYDVHPYIRPGVIIGEFQHMLDVETTVDPDQWGFTDTFGQYVIRKVEFSGPGAILARSTYKTQAGVNKLLTIWNYASTQPASSGVVVEAENWYIVGGPTRSANFVQFSALGTYNVTITYKARHNRGTTSTDDDTDFTAMGTATFHVGPVADLEVKATTTTGAMTAKDQVAFTVTATNHGPDHAPAVRVPITLPAGMKFIRADSEDYDPRTGVWDIGELKHKEYRRVALRQSEGETLTIVAELTGDVNEPVTGSIKNHQDYCVRIKTGGNPADDLPCDGGAVPDDYTEHSTIYYDYRTDNNEFSLNPAEGWKAVAAKNPPYLTGLSITSAPTPNVRGSSAYQIGSIIEVSAEFSKAVYVTGSPRLRLQIGDEEREAEYADGSGTDTLLFEYTVEQWDRDDDGVSIPANPINASGHPIRDSDGNDAMLDYAGLGNQDGHQVGGPGTPQTRPQPGAVGRLTATARDGAVDLVWPAGSHGDKVFWELWRNDDPTWQGIFPRDMGSRLGYTVTGLENGTEYMFRVRAHYKYEHGDTPGPPSDPAFATPTGPAAPPPGQPTGPNTPPEFDQATAWADYCVNGGTGSGTEVARVTAFDQDGDRLTFYQVKGFDEIGDNYFTVSNATIGDAYWAVIRTSRSIPRNLEPADGFISIDLEVNDGRGGVDQIGVSLQYDSTGGNCQEASSRSTGSGESGSSLTATVKAWAGGLRNWWTGFWAWTDWGGQALTARP